MLTKHGGHMGAAGSVAYIFTKRGLIAIERRGIDEDRVMETALEAGAEDVREAGDLLEVLTTPETFDDVREALAKASIAIASAEVTMLPSSTVNVEWAERAGRCSSYSSCSRITTTCRASRRTWTSLRRSSSSCSA